MKILVLYCYKNIANIGLNAFLYIRVIWRFYAISGKLAKVRRTVAQISSPSVPAKTQKPVLSGKRRNTGFSITCKIRFNCKFAV